MRTTTSILAILWATACAGVDDPTAGDGGDESTGMASEDTASAPEPDPDPEPEDGDTTSGEAEGSSGDEPEPEPEDDSGTSTGDEPPPPPGLGCNRDDLLLCDDFEDGTVDDSLWEVLEINGGQVSIDGTWAYHGGGALRIHLPSGEGARAGLRTKDGVVFPVEGNHFFGRAFFHVDPTVPETHSAALTARGQLDGAVAQYRLDSNGAKFNSRYVHNPTVEQHGGLKKFGYDVPQQEWLCIEWEYDGTNDSMRYWMNGEEIVDMTVTATSEEQTWVAPVFEDFEIGWRTFQAAQSAPAHDVVWDAVALATFRIGCE
ncbi:hypothetical protein [Paraliomyxa miuraensis]|uniref:hypothetical protein n=1 Tax=Paraliomyxa miuraensis TaxID=376150 RepID=UPI0022541307|nr:hypothetical protein [Paraliomyxa miuraensis]MCX4241189.1 hypothetical protein [Paraliomyxa miuraensis]